METTILTDLWNQLAASVDLVLVVVIIACGYLVGRAGLLGRAFSNLRNTYKVLIVAVPVTVAYTILQGVAPGVAVATFFVAFGFHGVVLKFIDKWVLNLTKVKE